ncbi:MAG: hypothetical protein ABJD07_01575 [Gemmatimonadaceae bacterium]
MAQLTTTQYDLLERAITSGTRIVVTRRGTDFPVIPLRIATRAGKETIESRHPTTGDRLVFVVEEIDGLAGV